ncbi:peptide methionine sulfoxide reductase MsrB [Acrasis kona]|uniref:Peptide-methionine (R)-S-oxide reductase n=1 Tax=Acrasis kona TaxID=1008807 RepID=A0AAW2ZN29_9EUKA
MFNTISKRTLRSPIISNLLFRRYGIDKNSYLKIAKDKIIEKPQVEKTKQEWEDQLGREGYKIMREHGTERAFLHELNDFKSKEGTFECAGCGNELFPASAKFDSGSGWPSFYDVKNEQESVILKTDVSYGMVRVEVLCNNCHSHLGHVFDDAYRQPTGLRYCINGACIRHKN